VASDRLLIKSSAAKELEALPAKDRKRVIARIRHLASDPRPPGCEKLSGDDNLRIREGGYCVLYTVDDSGRLLTVFKIGHRREVYR